ncbi:MAG: hypothetical protein HYR66_02740 [Sphingobacteriales bacterium]|nr:hypothetical protein [Sphingobacteriales bacterium]
MNSTAHKSDFSRLALFLSAVWILAVGFFYYPKWEQKGTEAAISWDVSGYYHYLPAIFIYKSLRQQQYKDTLLDKYQPTPLGNHYEAYKHSSGNYVMKYSIGQSFFFAPFFLIAHVSANSLGCAADGYSYPYQAAIGVGELLIALVGLFFLRLILIKYFNPFTTGIVLLLYVLGTNYLEYASISNAMTHNNLFTLYCVLIWVTIKFYDQPTLLKAAGIGLLTGWAVLTRPSEIISVVIPVCWRISSLSEINNRLQFFRNHLPKIIIASVLAALVISIQLFYWKYVTGDWIVYSYQKEKYHLLHPYLAECLWQFRKGWLIYTPLMILAVIGFYFLYKQYRQLFWVSLLFAVPFTYLCFSWEIWWYGGSIGQRAMVQSYPMLAFPFAAAINYLLNKKLFVIPVSLFILLCCYYNIWLTHQAHKGGLLDAENMTRAYWQKILFKYSVPVDEKKLLDSDEEFIGERTNVAVIKSNSDTIQLNKDHQYSEEMHIQVPNRFYKWIRVSATIAFPQKEWDVWKMTQLIVKFKSGGKTIKEKSIRIQRLMNETSGTSVYIDVKIPKQFDDAIILLWNGESKKPVTFTNLKAEVFNEQ